MHKAVASSSLDIPTGAQFLVVGADEDPVQALTGMLRDLGHSARPAVGAERGRAAFAVERPDIVFLLDDIGSPRVEQMVEEFSQDEARFCVGVGPGKDADRLVQLFHAGIARYLHQPFSAASVDDCVRHVIGRLMQERTRRALEADLVESQEKLRQAVEDLEDSNTELERFAYIISHDLQEPLRNVSNYVQLLKKRYSDELDQDAHEFIEFASGGARRMRQLIQGLLEYSRVSTRGQAREPVDMQEVLQDVRHDLEPRIGETGASVTSGDMPTVQADPIQMRRLIQNLLGNALKFRSEEPPRVHVGAARKDGFWKFQVEDNGIGIRRDQQSSIFNIYRRLHREPQYEGTGIGLAVCKKIVERHGGHIWVHSHPGEGSTFFFTVPIEEAEG